MKTKDQVAELKRDELGKLGLYQQQLQALHEVYGRSEWSAVDTWIGKELNGRYLQLAVPGTSVERTNELRGEIAAMNFMRSQPKFVVDEIGRVAARTASLQDDLQRRHNRT